MQLRHVAAVVADLGPPGALFRAIGLDVVGPVRSGVWKADVLTIGLSPVPLLLLQPAGTEGAIARRLQRKGPGLHQLVFEVASLPGFCAGLAERGIPVVGVDTGEPFVDPRASYGALLGFVQASGAAAAGDGPPIDHLGWLVDDLDAARDFLAAVGLPSHSPEPDIAFDAVTAVVDCPGLPIELKMPAVRGPFHRELLRRGEGLHHVALRVSDLDLAIEAVRGAGVPVLPAAPIEESNQRTAFVDPRAIGLLIELFEARE
jgi:methylmalonyl-CoA/ethylmalonyl-CoA epimerase